MSGLQNQVILWCDVHLKLLNLTLILCNLPAHLILQIFDWLPRVDQVPHDKKIQLILAVKKSIDKVTWYGANEDASSDWEREYFNTYVA